MQMPDLDGMGTAREIRKLPAPSSEMPLIMLTSLGRQGAREEPAEFAAYITKPVKPSALFDALVGVLAGQPTRVTARKTTAAGVFDPQMGKKHPLRILLAEDNATNQKLALQLLARLSYQADLAGNGREVVEALERQAYDVVLMDVQMPEVDGLEATRQIRARFPQAGQPYVIAMTANAMQGDREMCLAAGMNDYVSKPIRVEALIAALSRSHPLPWSVAVASVDGSTGTVAAPAIPGKRKATTNGEAAGGAGTTEPEEAALDPKGLHDLLAGLGDDFDLLDELINTFLEDAPQLLAELGGYLEAGDAAGVRRIAHSLKSNGLDLGATKFAAGCKELEMLAKTGALEGGSALYAGIASEYVRVEAALRNVLRTERAGMSEEQGHILVVDDNRMNRVKLARSLEQQGHEVASAEDGEQALEMLAARRYDAVLLDIVMPGLDGFQVLERIKNDSDLRDIPVIVISAVDEMDSAVRCIEIGAEDYLPKPFNPVLLRARLNASLQKKKLRDLEKAYLQQDVTLRQSEKLATLGRLSAGIAHELNNPAAAAQRGARQLAQTLARLQVAHLKLG